MADKTATCKRCGSVRVGWAQSKKTGKYYLALATPIHSIQIEGRSYGETGYHINAHILHKCDEPNRGGFNACSLCGKHHSTPFGERAQWCESHPNAI